MNFFVRILKTLFGIWGGILFSLSMILSTICFFIVFLVAPKKKAPHIAHKYISRNWAKLIFPFFGVYVRVKNREFIDPQKTYVFVANHRSQLDIPAYAIACKNTLRFLAKEELTKIPLLGYVIKKLYISVNRKDKAARLRSMENMMTSLRDGISVFICPEGTRNKTADPLLPFHDGAFRLAIEAQVPLAVMTVLNSDKLLSPLHPIELSPGIIDCVWDKPIETLGMTEADIPRLKEMAIALMIKEMER